MTKDRILGLDLGTKTLGISLSDITKTIANKYDILRFENEDYNLLLDPLKKVIDDNNVSLIVLGFPKNMNNSIGERANITLMFKKLIEEKLNIEVILQDERLSSKQANDFMIMGDVSRKKRKKKVDSLAANIILQSYLDRRN